MHGSLVRDAVPAGAPSHLSAVMNPLVPLFALVCVPIAAITLLLSTDTGIESSLITASVKAFIVLGLVAAAMSYGASRLAERSKH